MAEFFSHWDPRRNLVIKLILFLSGPETPFPLGVFTNAGLHHAIGQWWIWVPDGRMADAGSVTQAPNTCLCSPSSSLNTLLKSELACKLVLFIENWTCNLPCSVILLAHMCTQSCEWATINLLPKYFKCYGKNLFWKFWRRLLFILAIALKCWLNIKNI